MDKIIFRKEFWRVGGAVDINTNMLLGAFLGQDHLVLIGLTISIFTLRISVWFRKNDLTNRILTKKLKEQDKKDAEVKRLRGL